MIRKHWFGLSLALFVGFSIGVAEADSVGLNFGADDAGGTGAASLAAADVAGVVAQANWNNANGPAGAIADATDDSGAATSLDVEWAAEESWSGAGTPTTSDGVLMNGWISENGDDAAPSTVSVAQIPYTLYDLYLYVGHDRADEDTIFTETGGAFTDFVTVEDVDGTTVAADPFVFNEITTSGGLGNYVKFGGLTQDSLSIEMLVGNGERAPLTGLQVVQIPEPSSLVLTGVVAIMLGFVVRRKK